MSDTGRAPMLLAHFQGRKATFLSDLEALVARESPSDDAALVSELTRWIVARLQKAGIAAEGVPCAGRGDALLARWGAETGGTLLLGHLDTVWPAGSIAELPFAVKDGVANGPGVFDMKAGVAVGIGVLEAIASGFVKPSKGVSLLLTPDEEVGSESSRELLVAEAKKRDRVLVLEPSGDGGAAKIARKGIGLARVTFQGVAAHAGLDPEKGASALQEMSRYVLFADALADREVGSTVVPTVASAGQRSNVVPEHAEVLVDYRVWTAKEGERLTAALSSYETIDGRVKVTFSGGLNRPPMEPTAASLEIYARAAAIAGALGFDLPNARVGGGSDGNLTSAAGVPTLDGLGPSGGGAHARTEHLVVDGVARRAPTVGALVEELAS